MHGEVGFEADVHHAIALSASRFAGAALAVAATRPRRWVGARQIAILATAHGSADGAGGRAASVTTGAATEQTMCGFVNL